MTNTYAVLIVGGGVIGMSIARELGMRRAGKITLIERGRCGEEASWAAAGMLGAQAETDEPGDMLRFCIESRSMYPRFTEELLDETGIDIELERQGTFYLSFNAHDSDKLAERIKWQTAAGLSASLVSAADARKAEPFISPDVIEAAFFPNDWQVDNRKLCTALRNSLEHNGVRLVENAEVVDLISDSGRIVGARTKDSEFRADMTVLAAGAWASLIRIGDFPVPMSIRPVRGQMIAYRTARRLVGHVLYSSSGYIVPRIDGRLLCGATSEDVGYVKSNTDEAISELIESAETMVPALIGQKYVEKWSGLRPRSADALPVIGAIGGMDGLFVAAGHYRNGILLAPKTAAIIADAITVGSLSEFLNVFGPQRSRPASVNS